MGGSAFLAARRRGYGMLAAVGVTTALVAAGCGGSSSQSIGHGSRAVASYYTGWPTQGTPKRGGTLTVDVAEAPNTFNPPAVTTGIQALSTVNASLFEFVPTSGDRQPVLKPILVRSWTLSANHRTYTLQLRPGLQFSNGQPLTAEDVAFSLNNEKEVYLSITTFKSAKAIGKLTVQIQLSRPERVFLETLSETYSFAILPKSVYEREGPKKFGEHPVGLGPFMLTKATSGNAVTTYVRNPYYTHIEKGEPYLNELILNDVEDDNARILAVRSGGAQVAQAIPYSQVSTLKHTPGVKLLIGPLWGASYIFYNRNKAPYNEVNVRKALNYAMPREEILRSVYKDIGKVPNSLVGELKYWNPNSPSFTYDIAKAKELLKHSSVPNGFNMTISTVSGETQGELLASILQSSYAQIGIHVTIRSEPYTTMTSNMIAGKFDFDLLPPEVGWSDWYTPDAIYSAYLNNKYNQLVWDPHASAKVLAELSQASASENEAERERLFREVQYQTYYEEARFIPGVTLVTINLASDSVRGFQQIPNLSVRFNEVWLNG